MDELDKRPTYSEAREYDAEQEAQATLHYFSPLLTN